MTASRAAFAVVCVALALLVGFAPGIPPTPLPSTAPPAEFASGRAMKHLVFLAERPHRIGSMAEEDTRRYLLRELRALDLLVDAHDATASEARYGHTRVATVRNIVARLRALRPASSAEKAVLLMAHYDTRSMTPGAADDGVGVVTLLETARALKSGPPLTRDVLFLFTDGEEEGLFGARAFVAEDPSMKDVGLVMNFEARGDRGPVTMFQTSEGSAPLIDDLAALAPRPNASSLTQAIYRRMPNDTDLTVFLHKGIPAFNFANIDGIQRYHAPTDNVTELDEGVVQHHGSYALALARHYATSPELPRVGAGEEVYFNAGRLLVHYSERLALPLAGLVLLLVIGRAAVARKTTRPQAVLAGAAGLVATLAAGGVLPYAAWRLAQSTRADYALSTAIRPDLIALHVFVGAALAVGATALVQSWLRRRFTLAERALGAAFVAALVGVLVARGLPGASYLLTWPTLFAAIAPMREADRPTRAAPALAQAACALPSLALLVPLASQLFVAFGPAAAPAFGVVIAFAATLALPLLDGVLGARRTVPLVFVAAAVAAVGALFTPAFDRAYPRPDTLFFAVDRDENKAYWATPDGEADEWESILLPKLDPGVKRASLPAFFPDAPGATWLQREVPPPIVDTPPGAALVDDRREGDRRNVRISVGAGTRAEVAMVYVQKPKVHAARVAGRAVAVGPAGDVVFAYSAPPPTGFEVSLELETTEPITMRVVLQRSGFPDRQTPGPRPPGLMAKSGTLPPWDEMQESDMTLLGFGFNF